MVAVPLTRAQTETGLRPFDPLRDLGPLADLLEAAFGDRLHAEGRSMIADLRMMRWMSPLVWALFHSSAVFRAGLEGYVWMEDGRLVGNVSLAAVGDRRWSIGNVAVHPDYRRRGIARQLMQAAIGYVRDAGGTTVLLEVHADNAPALHLYESLGFRRLDAVTDLRRPAGAGAGALADQREALIQEQIRPIPWHQWRKVYELALAATPPGAWQARPLRESAFRRSPLSGLLESLTGRRVMRWAVINEAGDFDAAGMLEISPWASRPHRLTLWVRPSRLAGLAEPLAAHATRQIASLPPAEVVARIRADPPHLVEALQHHGFVAGLTTVQMALDLRQRVPIQIEGRYT